MGDLEIDSGRLYYPVQDGQLVQLLGFIHYV